MRSLLVVPALLVGLLFLPACDEDGGWARLGHELGRAADAVGLYLEQVGDELGLCDRSTSDEWRATRREVGAALGSLHSDVRRGSCEVGRAVSRGAHQLRRELAHETDALLHELSSVGRELGRVGEGLAWELHGLARELDRQAGELMFR